MIEKKRKSELRKKRKKCPENHIVGMMLYVQEAGKEKEAS